MKLSVPLCVGFDHLVQGDQELAPARGHGYFVLFASGNQLVKELLETRAVKHGVVGQHVECDAHMSATRSWTSVRRRETRSARMVWFSRSIESGLGSIRRANSART